jgi:serine/threonine-protein kinase RsbW
VVDYAARGGASERRREDIALAVSEALSNVVVHAYDGRDIPGDVRVDAWIEEAALQVAVSDDGIGMAERRLGLGLALMGHVSDRLRLESGDSMPGMCVRMTFALD